MRIGLMSRATLSKIAISPRLGAVVTIGFLASGMLPREVPAQSGAPPSATALSIEDGVRRGKEAFDRKDYTLAFNWFRKLADQGYAPAQNFIGLLYERGLGVPQDYAKAAIWYRKAADQGLADGQTSLAKMYMKGLGVRQDIEASAHWTRKAAEQGDADAEAMLGVLYESGIGVPQDTGAAISWFLKAADKGHVEAKKHLDQLQQSADNSLGKRSAVEAFATSNQQSAIFDLFCTAKNGDTAPLYVDTDKKFAKYGQKEFRDGSVVTQVDDDPGALISGRSTAPYKAKQYVSVDESAIAFGDAQHKHRLDRDSGVLTVEYYNKFAFDPIHCGKRIKKIP
jgi:TPR repeat protein